MKNFYVILILVLSCNILIAQTDREFWFAVPKETSGHGCIGTNNTPHGGPAPNYCTKNVISFKITATSLDAVVTVSMPQNPSFTPRIFTVPAGQTRTEVLANSWAGFDSIYNNSAALGAVPVTGINNRGFLITADNDITVYYDYDNYYNREFFSLKGRNALGTDFYVPFQNIWMNDSTTYNPSPYSTVDIVATEDGTILSFTPKPGQSFEGRPDDSPWDIILNRGQSYCLRAKYRSARSHMTGLRIQSTQPIAVSMNDDSYRMSTTITCRDIIGDQLIPVDLIGSEYLVMSGNRSVNTSGTLAAPYKYPATVGEQIFVVATQQNTIIEFRGKDGTILYQTPVMNAGQSDYFSIDIGNPNMSSLYLRSTDLSKKFYVYHTTGIGCELGGAILPPITDCTGSNEVSFYRSNTLDSISVNLMIPYDSIIPWNDPSQSFNAFRFINYQVPGNPDSVSIPGTWFEPNKGSGWATLKMAYRNFNKITVKDQSYKIINTKDFFHMGMANGTLGQSGKYGYFSDFNISTSNVRVASTEETLYTGCYGDSIILAANGGLEYTWHYGTPSGPPTYISDPKSPNPTIKNCPAGSHSFFVEVRQSKCLGVDTLKVIINILPKVTAKFSTDKIFGCSPFILTINNQSENADVYIWEKQKENAQAVIFSPLNNNAFTDTLVNKSQLPVSIKYVLTAKNFQGCSDSVSKKIKVFPGLVSGFSPKDTTGISPFNVAFKNNSTVYGNAVYNWNFGDYSTSGQFEPLHQFLNNSRYDTIYRVVLIAKDTFCSDTAFGIIRVKPLPDNDHIKEISDISVYPVPAKDYIYVEYSLVQPGWVNIETYSSNGRVFGKKQEYKDRTGKNISKLDIRNVPESIFFIKIVIDKKSYSFKIIKEK